MNRPLFKKALDHIKANPEEWDQGTYCGVPCCFAAHVNRINGFDNDALQHPWVVAGGKAKAERITREEFDMERKK